MKFHASKIRRLILGAVFLPLVSAISLLAQAPTGALQGHVTDPSGAAVIGAIVSATSTTPGATTKTTKTNQVGEYQIKGLAPGAYTIKATAPSFAPFSRENVVIVSTRPRNLNVQLKIEQQVQQVTVSAEATHVSVSPENNASAVVIQGKALQSLSNDPDELQAELEALAGPAAGPNGGQIYIDGFSGGQLPPKSDILAVHVNQNPFSAQYPRVGYGRIEIITKPGSSHYHGSVFVDGNDSAFNARNPFVTEEPAYHSEFFNGNIGGPLGKKASFFFDMFRRNINDSSIVNAIVLDPNFNPVSLTQAVPNPRTRMLITPRIDYQVSAKNILMVRYQLWQDSEDNSGVGQFALPTQAFNSHGRDNTIEMSDTQIISDRTINQTRFRWRDATIYENPLNLTPAVGVLGAFTGGGSTAGTSSDSMQEYELHNLTTMTLGKHTVIFGGRARGYVDSQSSTDHFNGAFTFPNIAAYQITEQGLAQGLTPEQIRVAGGGASQFSITTGHPVASISQVDLGLYGEDQWRPLSNLSVDLGLRFETQNNINDHADFAPRIGLAWGLGHRKSSSTVLRAGFGLFYDRFQYEQALQAVRLNGVNQQSFLITNPDFFPTPPTAATLAALTANATTPSVYNIDSSLRAPYTVESAVSIEQQIAKNFTASVTYLNSHGVHQFFTRNINTPLPGAYNPADPAAGRPFANVSACGVAPAVPDCADGYTGNIFQFESDGLYNQNEIIANFNASRSIVTLFGYYTLNYANSDTNGISSSPSNPYDILQDYGRALFDVRNRVMVGGAVNLPYGFRIMPFLHMSSGAPYDVTIGHDLLGTSVFNQRPAFAAPGQTGPNIIMTTLGNFNIAPALGAALIPVNYGDGPGQFDLNMRLSKTFGFGEGKGGGGGGFGGHWHHSGLGSRGLSGGGGKSIWQTPENSRYTLTFSVGVYNLFNNVNLGRPVGNLGSPLFGQSNSLAGWNQAANRRVDLQMRFGF